MLERMSSPIARLEYPRVPQAADEHIPVTVMGIEMLAGDHQAYMEN